MKLVYFTAKRYPATTADHIFVAAMARAFAKLLGDNFSLVISGPTHEELWGMQTISAYPPEHFKSVFYFFWLPLNVLRRNRGTVFFSNDRRLLTILIFWKKLFGYKICSDWHMLFNDRRDVSIFKRSDYLVTTTQQLKELILNKSKMDTQKILVAYGGVDTTLFGVESQAILRSRLALPLDDVLIGYVGFYTTMGMSKGLDTMLRALALIEDKKVKMVFVGGRNAEIEEYTQIAKDFNVFDRTIFIPAVPSGEVPAFEQAMDMLVIPYPDEPHFRDYGFPMKVYEYMASKMPILYSDLPIIAEVIGDCATSFIPGSAEDLAKKIQTVQKESQKVNDLGARAYEKVQNYTWDSRAQKIISFLEGTL